jgi:hypothetical protein
MRRNPGFEIDYQIDLDCAPKRQFGSAGLQDRLRRIERARRDGAGSERLAEAREDAFQLRPLRFHCLRCPANATGKAYGCFGTVRTPISSAGEEWLVQLLPPELTPPREGYAPAESAAAYAGALARDIDQVGIDGSPVEAARSLGLLQRRRAAERKYGLVRRTRIASSQLLEVLFFGDRINPETGELLCRAFGLWEAGALHEDGLPEIVFTQVVRPDDDRSVADLKRFFYAITLAGSLDVSVVTRAATPAAGARVPVPGEI